MTGQVPPKALRLTPASTPAALPPLLAQTTTTGPEAFRVAPTEGAGAPSAATRLWAVDAGPSDDAIPRQAVAEAWARQMRRAAKHFDLSARAVHRLRTVARTIADLAQQDEIDSPPVAEALGYCRGIDR